MKKNLLIDFFSRLLNFSFLIFLISDIFIWVYFYILNFLNHSFPKQIPNIFLIPADNGSLAPEYDISVFFITLLLLIFSIWLFEKIKKSGLIVYLKDKISNIYLQIVLLVPLSWYFLKRLGQFPLSDGQSVNNGYALPYTLLISGLLVILAGIFFLIHKKPILFKFYLALIIILIAALTLVSKFPIYYYDYSFLSGPILEIARGKTLYTQIGSQYSFLLVLFLGYLAKFSLFDIAYLPILVWFFYIIQYFICFYLILKLSKSISLALLTLFSIITVNFFALMLPGTNLPQVGPIRWLPMILSLYFLYRFQDIKSKKFILGLVVLSLITVDSGIYMLLAYGMTILTIFIKNKMTFQELVKSTCLLLASMILILLTVNFSGLLLGYQSINILFAFRKIFEYSQIGFGMIPIPNSSFVWLIIGIFTASIIYFYKKNKNNQADYVLLYSSYLSIFSAIYYFGRSHPSNLLNISLFVILNAGILISMFINQKSVTWAKPTFLIIFYLLFIVFPVLARGQAITDNIKVQLNNLNQRDIFIPEIKQTLTKYNDDVALINQYIPQKSALIIFFEDTYLFYLSGKNNLMNMDPQAMIRTKQESDYGLVDVFKTCPRRIAVDCKLFNRCGNPQGIEDDYLAQRLSLIENHCKIKYYPLVCADLLCIGQAK